MPMETNSTTMPTNIQPVQRPRPGAPTTITRRGDSGGSPFAPRTDVNIKNSVSDMAGILAKVSENQESKAEALSPQLQKLMDSIMQQSFSLESTLANGLGSSIESQRFAVDQMLTLSRLLGQLGSLAEQGVTNPLDSGLEAVLANFREMIGKSDSGALEPALLHKLAFQLLDTKTAEDLPDELKFLLLQGTQTAPANSEMNTESLGFLKQLMQYFMPSPEPATPGAKSAGRQAADSPDAKNAGTETPEQEGAERPADAEAGEPANRSGRPTAAGTGPMAGPKTPGQPSAARAQTGQPGSNEGNTAASRSNGQEPAAQPRGGQETAGQSRGGQETMARAGGDSGAPTAGQTAGGAPASANTNANANTSGNTSGAAPQPSDSANTATNAGTPREGNAADASEANRNTSFQKMPSAEDLQSPAPKAQGQAQGQPPAADSPRPSTEQPMGQPSGPTPEGQPSAQANSRPAGGEARPAENSSPFLQPEDNAPEGARADAGRFGQPAQAAPNANGTAFMPRSLPMQNTPQTMDTMKQLASLLLKDAELTDQDQILLQNFVNNREGVMDEKSAKQLQLLLRLCQNNIPASVQQAAQQQNLPELPKLWAFMQLCNLAYLKEKNSAANLKRASKSVSTFASMMKGSMTAENYRTSQGQRSMNFMMPLYMGEGEKTAYPTYIHVYDEEEEDPAAPGQKKKETWLRVCLLTENIGAVDVTFRMYEESNLDVRVFFSDPEVVDDFREYIPEFRQSFKDTPLTLMDLKINTAGDNQS
ncbi:MAG: hypothetical protein IJS96_03970 [Schwartzia sp.]|nr:hypothetical protein [Schwartzia sp. (in: firmicutes)]